MTQDEFLHALTELRISNTDRAVALLWWHGREDPCASKSPAELASAMEAAGYSKQNVTRMKANLRAHRMTARAGENGFKVRLASRKELDEAYSELAQHRKPIKSNALLPLELFQNTRGYIEKVAAQLNASYEYGLYDCCAVMCRRLVETLIVEAYSTLHLEVDLKGSDGNFLMLSGLITVVESSNSVGLTRNGLQGLKDFKRLGDLSAHNRRFNARKDDLDRVRDGLRVACEEFLKIAFPMH
jgi:hypothetical protein